MQLKNPKTNKIETPHIFRRGGEIVCILFSNYEVEDKDEIRKITNGNTLSQSAINMLNKQADRIGNYGRI